jgi:putative tryptophan/tyrosine transport system substrate-binding protein
MDTPDGANARIEDRSAPRRSTPFGQRALALVLGAFLAVLSHAGQSVPQVGIVFNSVRMADVTGAVPRNDCARAMVEGLREQGWVDGRNVRLHWRSAEDRHDRRPALIEELARLPVDVLFVGTNDAVSEALSLAKGIPIVANGMQNVLENGWVKSLSRPGGSLTGLSHLASDEIYGKRLALLKQAAPRVTAVAFLTTISAYERIEFPDAARIGVRVFKQDVRYPGQIEAAVDEAARKGANGLLFDDATVFLQGENMVTASRAAERHRLPAIFTYAGSSDSGGMMTYSEDIVARCRRSAHYIHRILRGTKPGDIPIELPSKHDLVFNLRAARAIGVEIPQSLLMQADRVID